jgi:hypothetical protein
MSISGKREPGDRVGEQRLFEYPPGPIEGGAGGNSEVEGREEIGHKRPTGSSLDGSPWGRIWAVGGKGIAAVKVNGAGDDLRGGDLLRRGLST